MPEKSKGKGQSKVHTTTGHEGLEGEQKYIYSLHLTSALDRMGGQRHAPAALPPGKTRYQLHRRLGGPQKLSGRVRKNFDSTGIQFLVRPARSEWLHQLRYKILNFFWTIYDISLVSYIRGVPGGMCQTSGECSLS